MLCASDAGGSAIFTCIIPAFLSTKSEMRFTTEIQRLTRQINHRYFNSRKTSPLLDISLYKKELFYMEQQSITKYLLLHTLSTTFMEKQVKFPSAWAFSCLQCTANYLYCLDETTEQDPSTNPQGLEESMQLFGYISIEFQRRSNSHRPPLNMQRAKREEGSRTSLLLAMVKWESTLLFVYISYCPLLEAFLCGITLHSNCSTISTFASFYVLNYW